MATETYSVSIYGLPADQTDSEHQVPSQDSVHLMPPVNLSLTGSQTAGNSGCYDVQLQWELPYFEDTIAFGYGNKPSQALPVIAIDDEYINALYVVIGWDTRLKPRKDLYVIGMEYFIGEGALSIDGCVYLNEATSPTYMFPQKAPIRANEWNTLMFDSYIPMDQPEELAIGYKVTFEENTRSGAFLDEGPGNAFYGDLISFDCETWYSCKYGTNIDANWCINALVVNKPDLDASAAVTPDDSTMHGVAVKRVNFMDLTDVDTVEAGLSNRAVRLRGFNVYRGGEKLNDGILKNFSYLDRAIPMGEYEYVVEAVYGNGTIKGEGESIDLADVVSSTETPILPAVVTAFPNPAHLYFQIKGEYLTLEIMDLAGHSLRCYRDGRSEIDVSDFAEGLYMLRFTLPDGAQRLQKIVLN